MTAQEFWEQAYLRSLATSGTGLANTKANEAEAHWLQRQRKQFERPDYNPAAATDPLEIPFQ